VEGRWVVGWDVDAVTWVPKKSQKNFFGSPGAEKAEKRSQTVLA